MINLENRNWKQFRIKDLFEMPSDSHNFPKKSRHTGNTPLIGALNHKNGLSDYISSKKYKPVINAISVNDSGQGGVGLAFYHPYFAYYSNNTSVLINKLLSNPTMLFVSTCISQQHTKFSYGYILNGTRLENLRINLPVDDSGHPDWKFMADYMKQVRNEIPQQKIHNHFHNSKYSLNKQNWKQFKIRDLGKIISSSDYPKKDRINGNLPYVGRTRFNNGITDYITRNKNTPNKIYQNVIAVNRNGSTGYAFYHPYKAYFSGGVRVIRMKHLTINIGLFISTCISQQRFQFNYGFELGKNRLNALKINLPVDVNGHPNWQFMNDYMKSMIN